MQILQSQPRGKHTREKDALVKQTAEEKDASRGVTSETMNCSWMGQRDGGIAVQESTIGDPQGWLRILNSIKSTMLSQLTF